jgi:hypothetical protein
METTQGISLYLKLAKNFMLPLLSSCFFFYKIGEQVAEQVLLGGGRGWHQWEGRGGQERSRRMNTVQIMYTHM